MMNSFKKHISFTGKSFLYYRREYINQILIIALLAAITTGSLLTGDSVRESLKRNSREKLGNTFLLASTGLRYFDKSLSDRMNVQYNLNTVPLLETDGYCQNFETGATALNIKIYGIDSAFFRFHGIEGIEIPQGTAAINRKLANYLGLTIGDEIIVKFREADPIPENAPFAPAREGDKSQVFTVSSIAEPENAGNFSLEVSQIAPMNVYINIKETQPTGLNYSRYNRLMVGFKNDLTDSSFYRIIKKELILTDIGLKIRKSDVTGEYEIISDRVFIDSTLTSVILSGTQGYPVISYLANRLKLSQRETPYSFISGIGTTPLNALKNNEVLLNKWAASDLNASVGDTVSISWFYPSGNKLDVRDKDFIITGITGSEPIFNDPYLMPEFPGISGSVSCSAWDAGIPVLLEKIRDKDEDYWNRFKGTPKAYLSYESGKKLWGNNFGLATSIRIPGSKSIADITESLKGKIEPSDAGFTVLNVKEKGISAASQGVDFGTLFISLGFFIILSCIILLTFTVSIFFDSRKDQVRTYYSLGYRNTLIGRLFFTETLIISISGAAAGVLTGFAVNILLVYALNTVWTGAVQTDTISPSISLLASISGFIITIFISQIIVALKLRKYLNRLLADGARSYRVQSLRLNVIVLLISLVVATALTLLTFISNKPSIITSFAAGIMLCASFSLALRQYYLKRKSSGLKNIYDLSKSYYRLNPSQAIAPMIFIASGIFAIIITSSNRQVVTEEMLQNKGGTGGYLLWSESALPVKQDLNSDEARKEFGLKEPGLEKLEIVQILKLSGDDASCLNLNHIKTPPLLGVDPEPFIFRNSFSFSSKIEGLKDNPWELLNERLPDDIIYGIADQTVMQWGLMKSVGDTLFYISEKGKSLKIVLCAGLKSSLFQGNLIIGEKNLKEYFPSVAGSSVFLFDIDNEVSADLKNLLSERFLNYGMDVENASEKLASFFIVTNTYLDVFTILGILGMILGVAGLGFMMLRNFEKRKSEFALLYATGFKTRMIINYLLPDQMIILIWGIITGTSSALVATFPSLAASNGISPALLIIMISAIMIAGISILIFTAGKIKRSNLVLQLRKD